MMDETRFWEIIDSSRERARALPRQEHEDPIEVHERTLADALGALTPSEILEFDARFTQCFHQAYRWDLWAAAYWLHGGCSDDSFMDFRGALISLGKQLYHQVLENPDVLADIYDDPDAPYLLGEGFLYVPNRVYEELTSSEMPDHERPPHPRSPKGKRLDHDDQTEMERHFPRLVAKYPDMG